ncbi:MAG: chalcone isomerase family protein [Parachlamydiaceae bacterium]|nr:chalcone isomerase family protein [Parachlamydiaceae bacterium]
MYALKLAMIGCLTLLSAFAIAEVREGVIDEFFPSEVTFEYEGKPLRLQMTGESIRKKFFVNVYSVAHYLQEGPFDSGVSKFQAILNDDKAKQLTFKWLRTVEVAKVRDGYDESFKKILSQSEYAQLKNEITQFLSYYNVEVRKGDEHILRWLPRGNIEVIIKGNQVGNIINPAFAKALWSIWLGDKTVVDREKLVSLLQ